MTSEKIIIVIPVAACFFALSTAWHWFRSRSILEEWATAHGYKLVKMSMTWSAGPFGGLTTRQSIYRIRVRDRWGRERRGWALCGGSVLGFLVDKVEVKWS